MNIDPSLLHEIESYCPALNIVVQEALAKGILALGQKLRKLFPDGQLNRERQEKLDIVARKSVFQLLDEFLFLKEIGFYRLLQNERVLSEIEQAVLSPVLHPESKVFAEALQADGFDERTLPLSFDDIFKRLLKLLEENIKNILSFDALILRTDYLRGEKRLKSHFDTEIGRIQQQLSLSNKKYRILIDVQGQLQTTKEYIASDYRDLITTCQTKMTQRRFAEIISALHDATSRKTFHTAPLSARSEIYRILGNAYLNLDMQQQAQDCFTRGLDLESDNYRLILGKAECDLRKGRLGDAEKATQSVLKDHEDAWGAYRLLAIIAIEKGDIPGARRQLEKVNETEDKSTPGIVALCDLLEDSFDSAISHIDGALKISPDDPLLLLQKAQICLRRAFSSLIPELGPDQLELSQLRFEEARNLLEEANASWDRHGLREHAAEVKSSLAVSYSITGDQADALRLATEATQCSNANQRAWITRARCELDSNKPDLAEKSIQKALTISPNNPEAVIVSSIVKDAQSNHEDALLILTSANIQSWPEEAILDLELLKSGFLSSVGRHKEALENLEQLQSPLKEHPKIISTRAKLLISLDKKNEASTILELATSKVPDDPVLFNLLASIQHSEDKYHDAFRNYARAQRIKPNSVSLAGIANILILTSKPKTALRFLNKAEQDGALITDALLDAKANVLLSVGNLFEADKAFDEYLSKHPDSEHALHNAAACNIRLGRSQKSIELLERFIKINDSDWRAYAQLAKLYFTDGNSEQAFNYAKLAYQKGQNEPEAHGIYISIGLHSSHSVEVTPVLQEFPDRFPDSFYICRYTVEEGIEHINRSNERANRILKEYNEGRLPIGLAAQNISKPLVLYRLLLQESSLKFLAQSGQLPRFSTETELSQQIIADYSSLITMAQQEIASVLTKCFERIYITANCQNQIQADKFAITQRLTYLSDRKQKIIKSKLLARNILDEWKQHILQEDEVPITSLHLDRYLCQKTGSTYLTDRTMISEDYPIDFPLLTTQGLVEHLWNKGIISKEQYDSSKCYLEGTYNWKQEQTTIPEDLPKSIVIECFTLYTLEKIGILDILLASVNELFVSPITVSRINQDIAEEEIYERALSIITSIEKFTDNREFIEIVDIEPPEEGKEPSWHADIDLAIKKQLPFWSDDQATKLVLADENKDAKHYSTRTILDMTLIKELITEEDFHKIIIGLIRSGFHYCSYNNRTLFWTLRRHNFQQNSETVLLLDNRGNEQEDFERVIALTILDISKHYDETRSPDIDQLREVFRLLAISTSKGSSSISGIFIRTVTKLLGNCSEGVQSQWQSLTMRWNSLGYIKETRGRIKISHRIWRPGDPL